MIYGDAPGRYDKMFNATLFHDDEDAEFFGNAFIEIANFFYRFRGRRCICKTEKAHQLNELAKKQQ